MPTRRRWTDASIAGELAPIVAELGRMPARAELSARGLGGAWSAMQRRGGLDTWSRRLTAAAREARPSHHAIEQRAYFIALERGDDDPIANWLAAEAELVAA